MEKSSVPHNKAPKRGKIPSDSGLAQVHASMAPVIKDMLENIEMQTHAPSTSAALVACIMTTDWALKHIAADRVIAAIDPENNVCTPLYSTALEMVRPRKSKAHLRAFKVEAVAI